MLSHVPKPIARFIMPYIHAPGYRQPRSLLVSGLIRYRLSKGTRGPLPSFLIIGTQRGGTTYLYDRLLDHPAMYPCLVKEVHYFDRHFARGPDWYRAHFSPHLHRKRSYGTTRSLTGEATPCYLFHPHAAHHVHHLLPTAKLVVLLRDPVERAYSHYLLMKEYGVEPLSFEAAIRAEPERTEHLYHSLVAGAIPFSRPLWNYSYVLRGIYADQLLRWMAQFPAEQVLVLPSETLFRDPPAVVHRVWSFLELAPANVNVPTKHRSLSSTPMTATARQLLTAFYRPHNDRLFNILGVDYGWNH